VYYNEFINLILEPFMMLEQIAKNLVMLKQEFAQSYNGHSHIQELIPISASESFPITDEHLESLHNFAVKNPIYHNSYEQKIAGILCKVYEGDINEYWLNSIKHGSSCQPFYPTWILSAYIATLIAKSFDYKELVDIGSGDGRIAYCAKILDLQTTSIEIVQQLQSCANKRQVDDAKIGLIHNMSAAATSSTVLVLER